MAGPELRTVVQMLRENPPVQGDTVLEQRANMAAFTAQTPLPEDVDFEPVEAGGVAAEWVRAPGAREDHALLHLHGGAYTMGGIESHRGLAAHLSRATRRRVLLPDYRLAPEHPHPAAVEDAVAAAGFASAAVGAPWLALSGDSAGGGLALATLVALRDAGVPLPAAGISLSGWLDLTLSGESIRTRADEDVMCTEPMLRQAAEAYCKGSDPRSPTASPLFADLAGLPPLLLQVGTAEILLDDSVRLAERARAAGVDVTLEVEEELIHVYHAFADALPEGRAAIERIAAFLDRCTPDS